jgi:hypothetical protein
VGDMSPNTVRRAADFLLIEEFDKENDFILLEGIVRPYFSNIFLDVVKRRLSPTKKEDKEEFLDNVAFFEYTNLPGIINDRFYATFEGSKEHRIG